ncbi:MAG: fumarate hydratase [Synergistaceae bacterium]|nr:fumarate hydratase [Synergistaceae bacterium]
MFEDAVLTERFIDVIRRSVCELPEDSLNALREAHGRESDGSIAKAHLETNLTNLALSTEHLIPMCADTGFPVFFVRAGKDSVDLVQISRCAAEAVRAATANGYIRPNAVEPLTRKNPGTNVGTGSPLMEWRVDPSIDCCEVIYVPKGGGTEIFGPAFRTILPADGVQGLKKFIFDTIVVNGNRTGATCPPNIIGVGVGGTSEGCMAMAKQAACLRKVGSRNPDPIIRDLEAEMLGVINSMGIGPLGMGGKTTILDLHIEFSMTHLVGTPVAIAAQCPAARVGTLRLHSDGRIEKAGWPGWFSY